MSMIFFILGLSVPVKTAAIVLALRLIKITGGRLSWILISASIVGMEARRCITLFEAILGETTSYSFAFELVGLITSALMLAGIAVISPLFMAVKEAEEKQKNLVASLQNALAKIKTLSGILPICASCATTKATVTRSRHTSGAIPRQSSAGLRKKALSGLFQG